jgi:hypothetical protein
VLRRLSIDNTFNGAIDEATTPRTTKEKDEVQEKPKKDKLKSIISISR